MTMSEYDFWLDRANFIGDKLKEASGTRTG